MNRVDCVRTLSIGWTISMCWTPMCRKLQATPKDGVVLGLANEGLNFTLLRDELLLTVEASLI